ncbi:MAG TPA: HisA/HisF-related TIM barrel protein [Fimbriimonadales bacterium]|nr:HisA/HisF-related TIM barrel protein [Fimbriimonadales bacterium]
MDIYAAVDLAGDPVAEALKAEADDANWIHFFDAEGEVMGGPQNIAALHRVLGAVGLQVQFQGGVRLVHTAELVLGLGASRVVVDSAETITERALANMFSRFGDGCAAIADGPDRAKMLMEAGCRHLIYTGIVEAVPRPDRGSLIVHAQTARNALALRDVGVAGVIVDASLVSSIVG